ncbi:MAG: hypothetical protein ACRCTZ_04550 [Sarcina sp.]
MHKRLKHLIKNMKDVFNIDEINKIQLQYELLTGSFMRVDIYLGTKNAAEYLNIMKKDTQVGL